MGTQERHRGALIEGCGGEDEWQVTGSQTRAKRPEGSRATGGRWIDSGPYDLKTSAITVAMSFFFTLAFGGLFL